MLKQKTLLPEWTNTHPKRLSFRFSLVLLEKCPPANLTDSNLLASTCFLLNTTNMRLPSVIPSAVLLLFTTCSTLAASSWSFSDATLSVQGKGSGVGGGIKEKCVPQQRNTPTL
jgi:hypothetical protein